MLGHIDIAGTEYRSRWSSAEAALDTMVATACSTLLDFNANGPV
jgi:hypothetical protein